MASSTVTSPLVLSHHMRVSLLAGELVANRIRARQRLRPILPTGHTPLGMYTALRAHAADGSLPMHEATLFQLDEYVGVPPTDGRSHAARLRWRSLPRGCERLTRAAETVAWDEEQQRRGTLTSRLPSREGEPGPAPPG